MKNNYLYKQFLWMVLFSGLSFYATAQRKCGTANSFLFKQQYPARYDSMQNRIGQFNLQKRLRPVGTQAIRTVPVVVHILYNNNPGDPTNISDAKIFSQVNIINQDFRKQNTDWTATPAVWQSLVADCEVRFCLASVDPDGNPTTGIIRRYTDSSNFELFATPKHNNTGGSDAWPTDEYLNLWVVPNIVHGTETLLGYASYPWDNMGAEDGVVIAHDVFGSVAPVDPAFNLGRTATHEIGHWLGLMHIWGDEESCMADDDVSDTPLQESENGGCPNFPVTDSCSGGNGVMFMNYMDYTNDSCMYMFTAGQKARMDYYLSNDHKSVVENAGAGCGDCPYVLNLSGPLSGTNNYRSADQIISTQNILPGANIDYKTGNKVTLSDGFRVASGANLHIRTNEVCYPPYKLIRKSKRSVIPAKQ